MAGNTLSLLDWVFFCFKKQIPTLLFAQNRIIYTQRQKVAVPVKLSAELVSGNQGWGGFALILFQAMPLRQKKCIILRRFSRESHI